MIPVRCAHDRLVPLSELKPHPKNPKKHSKEAIERQAQVMDYQGWRRPINVSNRSGFMTAGHKRLYAAKLRGETHAPVSFQDYESEEQEIADLVADNALNEWELTDLQAVNAMVGDLGPDFNIDLLGIKDFVIEPSDKNSEGEDEVPATPKEPKTKLGELWHLGEHRLLVGDCTVKENVARLMNGEKADMVFTDPPYGIKAVRGNTIGGVGAFGGKKNEKKDASNVIKANKYSEIVGDDTTDAAQACYEIAVALGIPSILLWGGNHYTDFLPVSRGWICWDKIDGVEGTTKNFSDIELAWTNHDVPARIVRHRWQGLLKASEHGEKRVHPTQKPVALAKECFELFKVSSVILDLFLGSGSTLIACEKTGRRCFGMEIDPLYIDVILSRWAKYTGQDPVREDGVKWSELQ